MKHPYGTCAAAAILIALICSPSLPLVSAQVSTKAYALPVAATDATSIVSNLPNFMVSMDEGGSLPSEPGATCENQVYGSAKSTAGFHLEHYFADAKVVFEQKTEMLRQFGIRQDLQNEAGSAAVVSETLDGAEAAYFVTTGGCDPGHRTQICAGDYSEDRGIGLCVRQVGTNEPDTIWTVRDRSKNCEMWAGIRGNVGRFSEAACHAGGRGFEHAKALVCLDFVRNYFERGIGPRGLTAPVRCARLAR